MTLVFRNLLELNDYGSRCSARGDGIDAKDKTVILIYGIYIVTSFGMIYLGEAFGNYGLLFIMVPIILGFYWGVCHFERLEKENDSDQVTQHRKKPYNMRKSNAA